MMDTEREKVDREIMQHVVQKVNTETVHLVLLFYFILPQGGDIAHL